VLTGVVVSHIDRIGVEWTIISGHPREPALDARIVRRMGNHHREPASWMLDADGFAQSAYSAPHQSQRFDMVRSPPEKLMVNDVR